MLLTLENLKLGRECQRICCSRSCYYVCSYLLNFITFCYVLLPSLVPFGLMKNSRHHQFISSREMTTRYSQYQSHGSHGSHGRSSCTRLAAAIGHRVGGPGLSSKLKDHWTTWPMASRIEWYVAWRSNLPRFSAVFDDTFGILESDWQAQALQTEIWN